MSRHAPPVMLKFCSSVACTHAHAHAHAHDMHMSHAHVHAHVCTHAHAHDARANMKHMHVHMHTHTHMHVHMHMHVCTSAGPCGSSTLTMAYHTWQVYLRDLAVEQAAYQRSVVVGLAPVTEALREQRARLVRGDN